MPNYKNFMELADLSLKGDKSEILKFLHEMAAKEIKAKRHSLYNGLIKLINVHSANNKSNITFSSFEENILQGPEFKEELKQTTDINVAYI